MKVKNYSGKLVERSSCRKIQSVFYEIGDPKVKNSGECYKIGNKYHRFNNGLIEYDHENMEYVLTNKVPLRRGVVDFDEFDKPIMGFFTSNVTKNVNVLINDRTSVLSLNEEILSKNYKEHYNSGVFYNKDKMTNSQFTAIRKPPVNKRDLIYDSRFASNITKKAYDKYYKSSGNNPMIDMLGKHLDSNGITFGVEFETSTGFIPERLCYKHGLIPLQDGSIGGLEYVTIPLSGSKGLYNLMDVCKILKERTKYDFNCSMHIHIGGLKRSPNNILAVNNVANLVENDIYSLQPLYKKDSISYGKGKNYSGPMKSSILQLSMNENGSERVNKLLFKELFNYLSRGSSFETYDNDLDNVTCHPSDPGGQRKWNITPRYCWFNTIPIVFTNKQTVEFRQHNNTFDFFKIFHFILTSSTIVNAANMFTDNFLQPGFLKSISNKSNILETITKMVAKSDDTFTDELLNSNLLYNKERAKIMKKMNEKDPKGETEHKYYSEFTNDING